MKGKIKHWIVENKKHGIVFVSLKLKDCNGTFTGMKEDGSVFTCIKPNWKYTPVYEDSKNGNKIMKQVLLEDMKVDNPYVATYIPTWDFLPDWALGTKVYCVVYKDSENTKPFYKLGEYGNVELDLNEKDLTFWEMDDEE